jgi:hypothetical protein
MVKSRKRITIMYQAVQVLKSGGLSLFFSCISYEAFSRGDSNGAATQRFKDDWRFCELRLLAKQQ